MTTQIQDNFRLRRSFGKLRHVIEVPNLIEIQKKSFDKFLQADRLPHEREDVGLQAVFNSVFPIKDFNETCQLNFEEYHLDPPKYDVDECRQRGTTYAASLRVVVRLILWDVDEDTGSKQVKDVIQQEVYFGDLPLMTEQGTFIINGTERVVVSQLHRSPGVFYEHDKGRTHASKKLLYSARVIPYRGSWIDFEFDTKDIMHVRIDRRRKLPATVLLRALGHTTAELLNKYYDTEEIILRPPMAAEINFIWWKDNIARFDIVVGGETIVEKGQSLTGNLSDAMVRQYLEENPDGPLPVTEDYLLGGVTLDGLFDQDGEIAIPKDTIINENVVATLQEDDHVDILQGRLRLPPTFEKKVNLDLLLGTRVNRDVHGPDGKLIVAKGKKFGSKPKSRNIRMLRESGLTTIPITRGELIGKVAAVDIFDPVDGDVLAQVNEEITNEILNEIEARQISDFKILFIDNVNVGPYLRNTLMVDTIKTPEEAILEIYKRLRPGEPPTMETATTLFNNLFFNPDRYDLSRVGRLKINHKFDLDTSLDKTTLTPTDILEVVRYLINLRNGKDGYNIDDIDHLGNRRVRAVGELLENHYRIGLVRMERAIKERMVIQEVEQMMPHDLLNSKPVTAVVKEFFGSSQLSQFMDQTNPLSEVTHKRRLSALGPGGLTRDRAGFEVRDVHTTHYGRICPIETPEGPNIGLIASLASYGRVNEFGFIETPYRTVVDAQVTDEVRYYSALDEEKFCIAQANTPLADGGHLKDNLVIVRMSGETLPVPKEEVQLMDVSPNQLVSIATSLIPFLEHDDANRALMGSNMQRQAVPLLRTASPLVGTGLERIVARDSGVTVVAKRDGIVDSVDANRIVVRVNTDDPRNPLGTQVDIYKLVKYKRSNQNTCMNQKPIIQEGDRVLRGDVIADGPATECGELALGQNPVVAFMPWGGYNFEDSILLSERMVKDDIYTSIHIEEFECVARDTKLGNEEITRDIPNVGEEALKDLDESGIIRIGAEVSPQDILVGKITPKGETQLSPEEKLLRAIFGEKAGDVRDTSLRVPPGVVGTVIDAKVFSRRKGNDADVRSRQIEEAEENRLRKDMETELKILLNAANDKMRSLLMGQTTTNKLIDNGQTLLDKEQTITSEHLEQIPTSLWSDIPIADLEIQDRLRHIRDAVTKQRKLVVKNYEERIKRLKKSDELAAGVLKMVKVYVAIKRKIQVGDKMAGRHGNKGVVSRILPEEDMPYLSDGTPVDIVLNPLGVPSRMNVGQILETHLGWAALRLGKHFREMVEQQSTEEAIRKEAHRVFGDQPTIEHFGERVRIIDLVDQLEGDDLKKFLRKMYKGVHTASPVFDGATEAEIRDKLEAIDEMPNGQSVLFDGRTGDIFSSNVTVGVMYMLKLHHLVDDKIHARSIGPYSLVTQQPLGGKAQFGGQRLGEMEVWAMEAYGAAYGLQEFLTVKSDDVVGRTRMYEAIVKGENTLESGLPESFNVLIKELQSLSLDVELLEDVDLPQS
ncbi:MAG: DNA-directed RNA polymerase subunit beta [Deltaproteobacteria bacterium]|nr:MAG: DNA-directed RNA polymerase subunit beta [Deltaproteobacteria bacterium]